jgi:hypothetical protein
MTSVRTSNRGDVGGMARDGEPIVNGCTDPTTLDWRFARSMMTRDQKDHAVTAHNRLVDSAIDRAPGCFEIHAVKIDDPVRVDVAAAQLLVPAAVERPFADRERLCCR